MRKTELAKWRSQENNNNTSLWQNGYFTVGLFICDQRKKAVRPSQRFNAM